MRKNLFLTVTALLFLCSSTHAQVGTRRIIAGTPPTVCSPTSGDVYIDTTVNPPDLLHCVATNKFERVGAGKVNAQTGTTYTLLIGDRGKLVTFNNGSPVAVTLPEATAAGSFLSGWSTHVYNLGAGTVTVTPTTSTINGAATLDFAQGEGGIIFSDGTNYSALKTNASGAPSGAAGGDLGGTYPNPTVTQARGLRETAGPTTLTMGAVADGEYLKRSGSTVVGDTPSGGSGAPDTATYITQTADGGLSNEQAMGALTTGIVKNTTTTGVQSIATVDDISSPVFAADAGANDTYTATLSPAPSGYITGTHYRFKANTANTGACTIDFNGLGAKAIKKVAGGITTDPADNDIRAGQWVDLIYDGTNMQMQSTLGNAAAGGTTINSTDSRIPYRSNSTTFADSFLGNDSGNGQTTSIAGHIMLSQNNGKILGFGNTTIGFGGIKAGQVGSIKVVADNNANPGTIYSDFTALANPGGNWAPWMSLGMNFTKTLTANITMNAPAVNGGVGVDDGYEFTILLTQDGTGSRTATWNSAYKWPGGTAPVLTTTAAATDMFRCIVLSSTLVYCTAYMDLK